MEQNGQQNHKLDRLVSLFKHPAVGIIGSLSGIIAIPLAIYFYSQTVSHPELVYYVNPAKAVVVKQGATTRLAVTLDSRAVTTDITAAQVAIWNRGKQSVRRESVLEPVVIRTDPSVPILEATIRKQSREVTRLNVSQDELSKGELSISWAILEQGDGGVIQLVYAGGLNRNSPQRCYRRAAGDSRIEVLR
jgi:hypothetical protein